MKIKYADVVKGMPKCPDYQGTRIIILADNQEEARQIDLLMVAKVSPANDCWYYGYKRDGLEFSMIGYDGFQASMVEEQLTGDRSVWAGKGSNSGIWNERALCPL